MKNILFGLSAAFLLTPVLASAQCLKGDCQNGNGTYQYSGGAKYQGDFRSGKMQGTGTLWFSNGNVYTGQWTNGQRQGKGKLTMKNGQIFEGEFSKNKMAGAGTMRYPNGDKYVGSWADDQPSGMGKYHFKSGERYEGAFVAGQFDGQGTMFYPDGARYVGGWKANRKHGAGKIFQRGGETISGEWANGEPVGDGSDQVVSNQNGQKPTEPSQKPSQKPKLDGLRNCGTTNCGNGSGYYKYDDGSVFVGTFRDGLPEGKGTCYYSNGDRYEGSWGKNSPHGEGIMYFASGRVYGATWLYGSPTGEIDAKEEMPSEQVDVSRTKDVRIWALCVGVARYQHMPTLRYTDDDAYQMFTFFKSPEGGALPDGQVKILIDEDASRENILRQMRSLFLKADENDVVMLYFSGHGLEGSFLPADFDGFSNKLRHDEIKQIFNESRAKHKICIADACHSGSLLAARSPVLVTLDKYYKAFETTDGGTALLMSSKGEELSLEDNGLRHGVFSHYLMKGMKGNADKNGDTIVTVSELFDYVFGKVRDYTGGQQTPVLTGDYDKNMPVAVVRN